MIIMSYRALRALFQEAGDYLSHLGANVGEYVGNTSIVRNATIGTAVAAMALAPGCGPQNRHVEVATDAVKSTQSARAGYYEVTVGTGDRIWTIAEKAAPWMDPRDVVRDIKRDNRLPNSVIHTGDTLWVRDYRPLKAQYGATHVVEPGDSLWTIAKGIDPGCDQRKAVYQMEMDNKLPDSTIHPGQRLRVRRDY